jgi:hypothetical protein
MSDLEKEIASPKKIIFVFLSFIISIVIIGLLVVSFFSYKKLTLSYDYCKSFGEINSQIGWVLKKNTSSCLKLSNKISGEIFFDSLIYTDRNGFRTEKENQNKESSILAIGDSWTFGYGVNGDETYPYFLSELLGQPIHNSGVPAFGSGSTYVYAKSNIKKLKPNLVIYLSKGLWRRSPCIKPWKDYYEKGLIDRNNSEYGKQLIPCYLVDPDNFQAKLLLPLPGVIEESVSKHIYPGGSLTAGYNSFWRYVFFTKPRLVFQDLKERLNLVRVKEMTINEGNAIKKLELQSYLDLAKENNFQFVLVDPIGDYFTVIMKNDYLSNENLIYAGKSKWKVAFDTIEDSGLYIPMDGHFTKKMNQLVADFIFRNIQPDILNFNN